MFLPGFEPGAFRVWSERDKPLHYRNWLILIKSLANYSYKPTRGGIFPPSCEIKKKEHIGTSVNSQRILAFKCSNKVIVKANKFQY